MATTVQRLTALETRVTAIEKAAAPAPVAPTAPAWRFLVPAYFYFDSPDWGRLIAGLRAGDVVILNPNSGVDHRVESGYLPHVKALQAKGVKLLGYIATRYGNRSAATITDEIVKYRQWYGVDGIFFDETAGQGYTAAYAFLAKEAVRLGAPTVVFNPGHWVVDRALADAGVVVTFEDTAVAYQARYGAELKSPWLTDGSTNRVAHMVLAVTAADMPGVMARLDREKIAWRWVTADAVPRPFDTVPPWFEAMARERGGGGP